MASFLYTSILTPIGPLLAGMDDSGLRFIRFQQSASPFKADPEWRYVDDLPCDVASQINAYFAGRLHRFDLPLAPEGTTFQLETWAAVEEIPYGTTFSYKDIAHKIGRPKAVRAVGAAIGRNPLPIVVPCHRVIGSNGSLTGYAGGVEIKQTLLSLERRYCSQGSEQLNLL